MDETEQAGISRREMFDYACGKLEPRRSAVVEQCARTDEELAAKIAFFRMFAPRDRLRRDFKRYLWRVITVGALSLIGAALACLWVSSTLLIEVVCVYCAVLLFALVANVLRNSERTFVPNGRILGDDEKAIQYSLLGLIAGGIGLQVVGGDMRDGMICGLYVGATFGLADVVCSHFDRTKIIKYFWELPARARVTKVILQLFTVPALAFIMWCLAQILSPEFAWYVAIGSGLFFARVQLTDAQLIRESKVDLAELLGTIIWGAILGVAIALYGSIGNGDTVFVRLGYSLMLGALVGYFAAVFVIESGVPLGSGSWTAKIERAVLLGLVTSAAVILVCHLVAAIFGRPVGNFVLSISPILAFFVSVRLAARIVGPSDRGRLLQFLEGAGSYWNLVWRLGGKTRIAGGLLRAQ